MTKVTNLATVTTEVFGTDGAMHHIGVGKTEDVPYDAKNRANQILEEFSRIQVGNKPTSMSEPASEARKSGRGSSRKASKRSSVPPAGKRAATRSAPLKTPGDEPGSEEA